MAVASWTHHHCQFVVHIEPITTGPCLQFLLLYSNMFLMSAKFQITSFKCDNHLISHDMNTFHHKQVENNNPIHYLQPKNLLSREPLMVFIHQMLQAHFQREPVNVLPKLVYGIYCLAILKTKTTDLVTDKASHHLEFHTTVLAQVHVLQQVCVSSSIESTNENTNKSSWQDKLN